MGAGGLMLLIGYVAPLPPAIKAQDDQHAQEDAHDQH